jgi:hypothetical protein
MAQKEATTVKMVYCSGCGQPVPATEKCVEPVGCVNRGYESTSADGKTVATDVEREFDH